MGFLRSLQAFDSESPIPLLKRGIGVYIVPLEIQGNALLSTVFVNSVDPGAYVRVSYYDSTTGDELGEEHPLVSHKNMNSFGSDRVTVSRFHNKPKIKAEVFGGDVEFSVYITVIDSTAADLDASLKLDGQDADLLLNKAMPVSGYDVENNQFSMLRTREGLLQVMIQDFMSSKWYTGAGVPTNSIGKTYQNDCYLDTIWGDVYQRPAESWILVGNIKGDPGVSSQTVEISAEAAEGISALRVVGVFEDGVRYISSFDLTHRNRACGVSKTSATVGNPTTIVTNGYLDDSSWNWDVTKPLFVGLNGVITQEITGVFLLNIGTPITSTRIKVNFQQSIKLGV